jgi:glycosyltransferase involved in cell wall biosynthesis
LSAHSPIRVFHLIKSLGRGGAEMLLPETLEAHNRSEFVFGFAYFLPWKNQVALILKEKNAEVHCFQAPNNIQLLLKFNFIASFLKKWKVDILHCHLPWAGLVGRLAGKLAGIPVVYTEHNKQERYHRITRWLNKITFSWQHAVIAVSQEVADSIRINIGDKTKVYTIVNGVNTKTFIRNPEEGKRIRESLGIPAHAKVIGLVAVLRVQKRIDLWLEAAAEIIKQLPDARFIVVGDGPCRGVAEEKISQLGLAQHVYLVGLQTETRPYYSAFDLFFMTSEFEGLPVAMLEAMSMKCAIVSTTAGGIGEVVRNGSEGLLFPVASNAVTLASGCVAVLKDAHTEKEFATNARQRVIDKFSIDQMTAAIETVYRDLMKRS